MLRTECGDALRSDQIPKGRRQIRAPGCAFLPAHSPPEADGSGCGGRGTVPWTGCPITWWGNGREDREVPATPHQEPPGSVLSRAAEEQAAPPVWAGHTCRPAPREPGKGKPLPWLSLWGDVGRDHALDQNTPSSSRAEVVSLPHQHHTPWTAGIFFILWAAGATRVPTCACAARCHRRRKTSRQPSDPADDP